MILQSMCPSWVDKLAFPTAWSKMNIQCPSHCLTCPQRAVRNCLWTVTGKWKCSYWNRITRALSDLAAGVSSILAVKTISDAKLTAPRLSTSGWLMALRKTPSDRRSSVSKQTCIPSPQTCLTSACSWHHTNTYLLTATMQSSTSV